jgi:hypothetical protein
MSEIMQEISVKSTRNLFKLREVFITCFITTLVIAEIIVQICAMLMLLGSPLVSKDFVLKLVLTKLIVWLVLLVSTGSSLLY